MYVAGDMIHSSQQSYEYSPGRKMSNFLVASMTNLSLSNGQEISSTCNFIASYRFCTCITYRLQGGDRADWGLSGDKNLISLSLICSKFYRLFLPALPKKFTNYSYFILISLPIIPILFFALMFPVCIDI